MCTDRLIWHNGRIIPAKEATLSVFAPTCQYGINVFEGIRAYWQEENSQLFLFRLKDHTRRLLASAKMLRIDVTQSAQELQSCLVNVVKANDFREDISIRQTIYLDGEGGWSASGPTTLFIAPLPKGRSYPDKEGLHCCISTWERINDNSVSPRIKAGANYINSRMAQLEAMGDGYDTAIFLNNQGKICEGLGSCIFMIKNGRLITPPLSASVLDSITRSSIIQMANTVLDISTDERDIDRTELYDADELFLCGTSMEIVPIVGVDRIPVGLGEMTKRIQALYFKIVRGREKSLLDWLTPLY